MAATYNPALTSNLDKVRFELGDTTVAAAILQDETINAVLTGKTVLQASAVLARGIAAQYAQKVDFDVDGEGAKYSQLRKHFAAMAEDLDDRAAAEAAVAADEEAIARSQAIGAGIMVGGLSVRENIAKSEDCDRAANFSPRYSEY